MLRLPQSQIKAGILHPVEEIRRTALEYFSQGYTSDPSIMLLLIETVRKYGQASGFRLLRMAENLPQTEQSLEWLLSELQAEHRLDHYRFALGSVLCRTEPGLLLTNTVDSKRVRHFPARLHGQFQQRLEVYEWGWEKAWRAFLELGAQLTAADDVSFEDLDRLHDIEESVARHADRQLLILQLLSRDYRDFDRSFMEPLESLIVHVAGRMRLTEAIPLLIERFHEDDIEVCDSCIDALARIGGDAVVRAIADQWWQADEAFRGSAANVLDHIHTKLCVRALLEFMAAENNLEILFDLGHSLLFQFAYGAIEPVSLLVEERADQLDTETLDLRSHLVAAATLMGVRFPEYDDWYRFCVKTDWGWLDADEPVRAADIRWKRSDPSEWN